MTAKALRALLTNLIDYAGLFPPAALSMQDAVRNYARYREGEYAWMLGRFVVNADRVEEVPEAFPLSVVGSGGGPRTAGVTREVKVADAGALAQLEPGTFVEIADLALLDAIKRHGLRAKIRTGGITVDAFPGIDDVAAFIRACKEKGVAFKATAGLHHPLRCVKPLTYETNAPHGTMHGFLNVFMAAALPHRAEEILREEDARAFSFDDEKASWREEHAGVKDIQKMRETFAISFGSCSFEEPIGDLRALAFLT
jgi:hypothetical protein